MAEKVIPFSQLSEIDRNKLQVKGVNWKVIAVSGEEIENWAEIKDPEYGTYQHVVITKENGTPIFDKVDFIGKAAAFVVVFHKKNEKVEFFLPKERRVLLKDNNGIQGNVKIRNIPQGIIKSDDGETPEEGAIREVSEETGLKVKSIQKLEDIYLESAGSQTISPFFLAEVDISEHQSYEQKLDDTEEISVSEDDWFSLEELISHEKIQCGKTLAGLMLATKFLGLLDRDQ